MKRSHPNAVRHTAASEVVRGFFDPLTPESAYVLGLVVADGCVYLPKPGTKRRSWSVSIAQSGQEGQILLKRIRDLVGAGSISKRCAKKNQKAAYSLVWTGRAVAEFFISLGITPRKAHTVALPMVSPDLRSHLVRGIFDGDGCVSVTHPKVRSGRMRAVKLEAFISTTSRRLADDLISTCARYGITLRANRLHHVGRDTDEWRVRVTGSAACRFLDWCYVDASAGLSLARKRRKYERYLAEKVVYDETSFGRQVRAGRRWSEAMDDRLCALVAAKMPLQKVAQVFDRSTTAIKNRMRALGLRTAYYWSNVERVEAGRMLDAGYPVRKVATELDRPVATVRRFAAHWRGVA